MLDWKVARPAAHDSVGTAHWERVWVRLVDHVIVLLHLQRHLLGAYFAAHVVGEVVCCIHPGLLIRVHNVTSIECVVQDAVNWADLRAK